MKRAIHYISDLSWFSERNTSPSYGSVWEALSAHRRYVERGGKDEDVIPVNAQPKKTWKKRVDGKFVVAIPNDLSREEAVRYTEELLQKIAEEWNLPRDHIEGYIHLHRSNVREGEKNYHVHVIVYPRTKEGKALRLGKKELRRLHRLNQEHLKEWGYAVVMREEWERLPHIGYPLHQEEVKKAYLEFLRETESLNEDLRAVKKVPPEEILPKLGYQLREVKGKLVAMKEGRPPIYLYKSRKGEWIWIDITDPRRRGSYIDLALQEGRLDLLEKHGALNIAVS